MSPLLLYEDLGTRPLDSVPFLLVQTALERLASPTPGRVECGEMGGEGRILSNWREQVYVSGGVTPPSNMNDHGGTTYASKVVNSSKNTGNTGKAKGFLEREVIVLEEYIHLHRI
ncbi:hypothetical protein V6N13_148321 [Hibiscus sabdariffa]